jgi:hypothetical protein
MEDKDWAQFHWISPLHYHTQASITGSAYKHTLGPGGLIWGGPPFLWSVLLCDTDPYLKDV